jgi:hypothetical protein
MAIGLEVYDGAGRLILDATSRPGRIKGFAQVNGNAGSVSADLSDGTPFYSFQPDFMFKHISNVTPPPIFTINSGGVSWVYSAGTGSFTNPITGWVIYGVF